MSDFHTQNVEYILLQAIAQQEGPVGAGFLADLLQEEQSPAMSEATIGRYLRKFEKQGFLKSEKYEGRSRGRIITDQGRMRIKELAAARRQARDMLDTMAVVRGGQGEHLRNILLTREIIEPEVAALAARNASEEDIRAIAAIVEESAELTRRGESMASTDAPFHIAIARASGNPVLEAVMRMLRTDRDYSPELESIINASSLNNPSDHQSIYQAIAARDADRARSIMKQHIHNLIVKTNTYGAKSASQEHTA